MLNLILNINIHKIVITKEQHMQRLLSLKEELLRLDEAISRRRDEDDDDLPSLGALGLRLKKLSEFNVKRL